MPDQNEISEDQSLVDRRAFLKKAGLAVGAAAALYVAPRVSTVKASPAYTPVTAVATATPTPTPTATPTPPPTPCPDIGLSVNSPDVATGSGLSSSNAPAGYYEVCVDVTVTGCATVTFEDNSATAGTDGPREVEDTTEKFFLWIRCDEDFSGKVVAVSCCSGDELEESVTVNSPCRGDDT